jgi:hypothetical protein
LTHPLPQVVTSYRGTILVAGFCEVSEEEGVKQNRQHGLTLGPCWRVLLTSDFRLLLF